MVNWDKMINKNSRSVKEFATGVRSGQEFQSDFSGSVNPARCVVRNYGVDYGRRLARKALKRRGLLN